MDKPNLATRGLSLEERARFNSTLIAERARRSGSRSFPSFVKQAWKFVDPAPLVWNWHLDAICEHLEAVARGDIKRLIINVPPRHGKPCYIQSMVNEKKKGRIPLSEVRVGDRVLTHRGRYRRVLAVHKQGILPLIKVTTHAGREIKTAPDHPYLTTRGWIEAAQLKTGDVLGSVHTTENFGSKTVSLEEARLIGYLIGDGHIVYPARASFTNENEEVLRDFEACAVAMGFRTHRKKLPPSHRNKNPKASIVVLLPVCPDGLTKWHESKRGPHPVWSWLELHGLKGKNSYTKKVPPAILAATPELISAFLGAYWSCDGYVSSRGGSRTDCCVGATSVSRDLAEEVQHLLCRVGVQARLRKKVAPIKTIRQGDSYTSWNIEMTSLDNVARFAVAVPMKHSGKRESIARYSRTAFDKVINEDAIVSVEKDGEGECRCLTVDEDETFTVNDIVVHNSNLFAILWPAWIWLEQPASQFLFLSYSSTLSVEHSVKCRQVMEAPWYREQFKVPWRLADDQNVKHDFVNTAGGRRRATSITGSITGTGGDIIGIDDPLNAEEAHSKAAREQANRVISEVVATRLNNPTTGRIALIQQRLHQEDPTGFLLESGGWEHLMLPSEFETERRCMTRSVGGTEFWRDPRETEGELLFPDRFPATVLATIRAGLRETAYCAQHLQRPSPAGGIMFMKDWWRFWKPDGTGVEIARRPKGCYEGPARPLPADFDQVIISVDANFKNKADADPVSIQAWGAAGPDRFLLHRTNSPLGFVGAVKAICGMLEILEKTYSVRAVIIETKANGDAIIETLKEKISNVIGINPEGGKEARAWASQPMIQGGNCYLPDGAPWLDEIVEEFASFPKGRHDDDVDAWGQAMMYLAHGPKTTMDLWMDVLP